MRILSTKAMGESLVGIGQHVAEVVMADNDDFCLRDFAPQNSRDLHAMASRHANVEQNKIGTKLAGFFNRFIAVAGFAAYIPGVFGQDIADT